MRTTFLSDRFLNHWYRNTASAAPATVYAGLITAITSAEAGTVTEASYAGYARVAITFGAPGAALGGRQITNSAAVTFAAKTDAGSVTVVAVGVWDALTVGNLSDIIPLDGDDVIAVIFNDITTDFVRSPAHGLANDQKVRLSSFPGSVTMPGEFAENTVYFVVLTATDEFKLSATQGGAAINYTTQGRALLMQQTDLAVAQNDQVNFAIGQLKLADD